MASHSEMRTLISLLKFWSGINIHNFLLLMTTAATLQYYGSDGQHVTYCDPILGIYFSKVDFLFNYLTYNFYLFG